MVGNYREKKLKLTANVSFEQKEQEKAISKLKRMNSKFEEITMKC